MGDGRELEESPQDHARERPELVSNDDNLSYGAIVTVQTTNNEWITALTDDGIDELKDMLTDARRSPENWRSFLDDFVAGHDIIARVKYQSSR